MHSSCCCCCGRRQHLLRRAEVSAAMIVSGLLGGFCYGENNINIIDHCHGRRHHRKAHDDNSIATIVMVQRNRLRARATHHKPNRTASSANCRCRSRWQNRSRRTISNCTRRYDICRVSMEMGTTIAVAQLCARRRLTRQRSGSGLGCIGTEV